MKKSVYVLDNMYFYPRSDWIVFSKKRKKILNNWPSFSQLFEKHTENNEYDKVWRNLPRLSLLVEISNKDLVTYDFKLIRISNNKYSIVDYAGVIGVPDEVLMNRRMRNSKNLYIRLKYDNHRTFDKMNDYIPINTNQMIN